LNRQFTLSALMEAPDGVWRHLQQVSTPQEPILKSLLVEEYAALATRLRAELSQRGYAGDGYSQRYRFRLRRRSPIRRSAELGGFEAMLRFKTGCRHSSGVSIRPAA